MGIQAIGYVPMNANKTKMSNDSLENIAQMTAEYERDLVQGAKHSDRDPLLIACIGLSNLTLDLLWSLQWLDTLKDRLKNDHMVEEFIDDLKARSKQSDCLQRIAQEANLL